MLQRVIINDGGYSKEKRITLTKGFAWMRVLRITFTSTKLKKSITIDNDNKEISMHADIYKYMSALKDSCTIKIDNLPYSTIVELISGEFYDVKIEAGYKNLNVVTVFDGGVLYISNELNDRKTQTAVILCASDLVAKFGQKRINLSLNSGINVYSALRFICRRAGITETNISTQYKKKFLQKITTIQDTPGAWINKLSEEDKTCIVNSDKSIGSTVSIFDAARGNNRIITLDNNMIDLTGGYPRLNNQGLNLSVMMTYNFMCGDIIKIDNSIINIGTSSTNEANSLPGLFLDKNGCYMIIEQRYSLENRGSDFSIDITAKSRSLISNIISR